MIQLAILVIPVGAVLIVDAVLYFGLFGLFNLNKQLSVSSELVGSCGQQAIGIRCVYGIRSGGQLTGSTNVVVAPLGLVIDQTCMIQLAILVIPVGAVLVHNTVLNGNDHFTVFIKLISSDGHQIIILGYGISTCNNNEF